MWLFVFIELLIERFRLDINKDKLLSLLLIILKLNIVIVLLLVLIVLFKFIGFDIVFEVVRLLLVLEVVVVKFINVVEFCILGVFLLFCVIIYKL